MRSTPRTGLTREMLKAGILNVTGYAGAELARILHLHPDVELTAVTGRSAAGRRLGDVFPHLAATDLEVTEDFSDGVDVVFSTLPASASAERLAPFVKRGVKAIDIGADFRLHDLDEYKRWYGAEHPQPALVEQAVYGLPELHRDDIATATLVGNPGCYSTAAILGLAPAVSAGIISSDIVIDGKSGVSGAGRRGEVDYSFSEVNESVRAYATNGHRHQPEVDQELSSLDGGFAPRTTFLPHLVPMTRGILASSYANLNDTIAGDGAKERVFEIYSSFYADHPFADVSADPPTTKQTLGNNSCVIHPTVDPRTGRLIVISCLDNLVKGAGGQAVQNMNLMFGLPERTGLEQLALNP